MTPRRKIRAVDLMCGLGGTSEGLRLACLDLGLDLELDGLNHWDVAIAMHQANHGRSRKADILERDLPLKVVPEGKLDLLAASPTCVTHSRCLGGRPISWDQRRGRMTPEGVRWWLATLDVPAFVIENVAEFREWDLVHRKTGTLRAPCRAAGCKPGRQCRAYLERDPVTGAKTGRLYRAWLARLHALGYRTEERILCCADYGDPTTRRRLFIMGRKDGAAIRWPSPTHAKGGAGGLLPWVAARTIIDETIPSRSIFGRRRPYSQKTLGRLIDGARRNAWHPVLIEMMEYHRATGKDPRRLKRFREAFDVPEQQAALLLSQHSGGVARPVTEPAPTQVAKHSHQFISPYNGRSTPSPVEAPLPTVVTRDRFALVEGKAGEPLVVHNTHGKRRTPRPASEPLPTATITTGNGLNVAQAFMPASNGERPGQAPRSRSVLEPVPTVCASGRVQLAQGGRRGRGGPDVEMRLLVARELAGAHSFRRDYQLLGTATDQVRAVGNSVPVETARALQRAAIEVSLEVAAGTAERAPDAPHAAGPLFAGAVA